MILAGSIHLVLCSIVILGHLLRLSHYFLWILICRGFVNKLLLMIIIIITSLLRVSLGRDLLDLDRLVLNGILGLRFVGADVVEIFYVLLMLSRFLDLNLNLFLFKIEITAITACLRLLKLKQLLLNKMRLLLLLMLLILLLLWLLSWLLRWLVVFRGDEAWLGSRDYWEI